LFGYVYLKGRWAGRWRMPDPAGAYRSGTRRAKRSSGLYAKTGGRGRGSIEGNVRTGGRVF